MATIHVDGKDYEVNGSDNLLHACLSLGLDIPHFCWHPALGTAGACRQCAVKQFKNVDDKRGKIIMSCMTAATDGSYISITDEEATQFRASMIELVMTYHPHDCPVCEEGGHCHLQDMTVMTGHAVRNYRFTKRTHQNQNLGPFIGHEMNRCINCYRCVRYYNDYADGTDFGVYGSHDNIYFGRPADGTLESEFSGNLTEICPTGVFTDKTHGDRYTRKWDLQYAPSICTGCSLGCNVSPGERYGEIRRIENRYNGEVNGYFLCDRGRFGYGYVNRKDRPLLPLLQIDGKQSAAAPDDALAHVGGLLRGARRAIGIGSPRASLESNQALRDLVGAENFHDGHSTPERTLLIRALEILRQGPAPAVTLHGIESADAALVLGEDVTQSAPMIALALRQTARGIHRKLAADNRLFDWQTISLADIAQHQKLPIYLTSVCATRLDDIAAATLHAAPQDQARFGYAVAHAIDTSAPAVEGLDEATQTLVNRIANDLLAADQPLVVCGTSAGSLELLNAAANITRALHVRGKPAEICLALPESNSLGVALLDGHGLEQALADLTEGRADVAVVLENDLYRRAPRSVIDAALAKTRLVVLDHQRTETTARAEAVLPTASVFEGDGTLVNNEGRAQRYFQVFDPAYYQYDIAITEAWRWLRRLRSHIEGDGHDHSTLDELTAACAAASPLLAGITAAAPGAGFRIEGLKSAREPHRYSGRTSMRANLSVHEPRVPQDTDSAMAFSMEGANGIGTDARPAALIPYAWAPGWNSPQAWNKFQDKVGGHLSGGDPGVRLIEPPADAHLRYFDTPPAAFVADPRELSAITLPQIYGTEELSALAAPIAARIGAAYVALSTVDATHHTLSDGSLVDVHLNGATLRLPVRVLESLPAGIAGLPAGVPGVPRLLSSTPAELHAVTTA